MFSNVTKKKLISVVAVVVVVEVLFISALLTGGRWAVEDPHELLAALQSRGAVPILMPAYNRPEVLREVLTGLAKCHNINETAVVISQDGQVEGVAQVIASFAQQLRIIHIRHKQPYFGLLTGDINVSWNTYFLLELAFEQYGFGAAIVLESDLVPSVDFYEFMKWSYKKILRDTRLSPTVFAVSSFNIASQEDNNPDVTTMVPTTHTSLLGWVLTDERWDEAKEAWGWLGNWDIVLARWRRTRGMINVVPRVSRVKHIGLSGGINFHRMTEEDRNEWLGVKMPTKPINYTALVPEYLHWNLAQGTVSPLCRGFKCI